MAAESEERDAGLHAGQELARPEAVALIVKARRQAWYG
jgi:hypothetical protein